MSSLTTLGDLLAGLPASRYSAWANVIPMVTRSVRRVSSLFALVCSAAVVWSLITPGTSAAEPSAEKPTIVLVHGAWADASSWDGEVKELEVQGYDVLKHIPEGELFDKVPVGVAFGGVGDHRAAVGVADQHDRSVDRSEEVCDVVGVGGEVLQWVRDGPGAYPGAPAGAVDLYLKKDIFLQHFGNDLPADEATRLWASQGAASTAAFDTPSRYAAWKTIPSWYFISSGDQIITPTSERAMAARAYSTVTEFDGGSHLTLISHPDAVTAVILDAVHKVTSQ